MSKRKIILGTLLLLAGLVVLLILTAAGYLHLVDRSSGAIVSSGEEREYLLYVPGSYSAATPTPLVISLHGGAAWPAIQLETDRWDRAAEEHGFLLAYPAGVALPLGPRIWRVEPGAGLEADIRFISELIDVLEVSYNVDPARIYVNGLSLGGCLAFALSCALADRIAAVGTVAAAHRLPWEWCADPRPMPLVAFHGTADRMVPYDGGSSGGPIARGEFPSVPEWTARWARRNGCAPQGVESRVAADVRRLEYGSCVDDANVVLYTVEGGGHTWPGGKPLPRWLVGDTSDAVDATDRMWGFFREHRLPRE